MLRPVPLSLVLLLLATPVGAVATLPDAPGAVAGAPGPIDTRGCVTDGFGFVPPGLESTLNDDDCAFHFHYAAIGAYDFTCAGPGWCLAWFQQGWSTYSILCEGAGTYSEARLPTGDGQIANTDTCDFWWGHGIHPISMTTWYAYVFTEDETDTVGSLTVCTTGAASLPCVIA